MDYFMKGKPMQVKLSVSSSLCNKNFYSETLLMALPFIVYGIFIFKRFWKTISIISVILILLTVFVLQTISVWLGLFAGMFLLLVAYRKIVFENKKIRIGSISVFVLVLIIAGIIIYSKPPFFKGIKSKVEITLKYITDPVALETFSIDNNNSTYERFILWRNSFRMIQEHPLTGVGLGEWKIYFPKYGMGMAPYMNYGVIRFEMPHNDFLLVACEAGIPALICYIVLFVFALNYSKKIISQTKNEKDKLLMRLMQTGLSGFIIISFFGFPGQRPFTMIFLMLTLAVVQSKYLQIFPEKEKINSKKVYTIFFISAIIISGIGFTIGKKRLKAEMHLSNALRAQRTRSWGPMIRETANAKSAYFPMDYASTPVCWYNGFSNFYSGNQEAAFISFKKAEKINPYHFNLLNDLGTCYDQQGNHDLAKEYYLKAIRIAPLFPDALINLSVIYFNSGNIDSAYSTISKCILKNQSYNNDLKAILFAKTQKIISQVNDTTLKAKLSEKINDDKWLRSVHEEALKSHLTFEDALQNAQK
ncbi:MAG: O-antigen ligase family protein [Bacteroidia bacterium]